MLQEIENSSLRQALEDGLTVHMEGTTPYNRPDREALKEHIAKHFEVERYEVTLVVWPDNDWCYFEDLHEYSHKSDDWKIIRPSIEDEDEIDEIVKDSNYEEDGY